MNRFLEYFEVVISLLFNIGGIPVHAFTFLKLLFELSFVFTIFFVFERYIWRWKLCHTPTTIWIIEFRKHSNISSERYSHRPTCESIYWSQNEVSKSANSFGVVNRRILINQFIIIDPQNSQYPFLFSVFTFLKQQ